MTEQVDEHTVERQGYNVSEGAHALGIGRTTLHKLLNEGRIRRVKVGARTIIPRSEIERFLNVSDDNTAA